jgi:hypothetical protein
VVCFLLFWVSSPPPPLPRKDNWVTGKWIGRLIFIVPFLPFEFHATCRITIHIKITPCSLIQFVTIQWILCSEYMCFSERTCASMRNFQKQICGFRAEHGPPVMKAWEGWRLPVLGQTDRQALPFLLCLSVA